MIVGWVYMAALFVFGVALRLGARFERQREEAEQARAAAKWPQHQPPT